LGLDAPRREGAITEDRGVATGNNVREKSSWWLPVGAALGVLGVVVVLARGTWGTEPPEVVLPATAASAALPGEPSTHTALQLPEPTPATEVQAVKITLRTIPARATLRIDGGDPLSSPYNMEVAPSQQLREITASSPNYTSVTRQVSFDQTREIVIELDPQQPQRPPQRPPPPHRGRPPQAASEPTPPLQQELPLVKPHEGNPGKRPRALDEDNPFAG